MKAFLLDFLFPKQCLSCAKEGDFCCEDCLSLIPITPSLSPIRTSSYLSGLFCATSYEDFLVQRLIHAFKYQPFIKGLAKPLALLIVSHFALINNKIYPPDLIIPIPLHKKRLKWRGYNHAEELAKQLSFAFSLPVMLNCLIRLTHTPPQINLNKEQRIHNMYGVFAAQNKKSIQNKTILLVDDVYTTGATMEESARILRKAGAAKVFGAAVARD